MRSLPPAVIAAALEDAPDAMLVVDARGTIRYANAAVAEVFGHPHSELIGHALETLIPERFRAAHAGYQTEFTRDRRTRAMGGHRLELLGLRADGTELPVAISLKTIYCDPEWFTVATVRDTTSHVLAERELREARERAERANLSKSRFLATASHDLRQPLQTLALLNGALRRVVADRPAAAEALAHQEKAIASMSRLLNALLDISKLESGAVRPEPSDFPVGTLFRELQEEFASVAASKGLTLEVASGEASAHSDPALVGQILRNLLSNAIKYTRAGGVTLRCGQDAPGSVHIEVQDTGIGIPADQLRHIYEEFYQVGGPHNPRREGYGLGLSIVQRLVALLDLKLDAQSELGRGSKFTLTLAAGRSAVTPVRPAQTQEAAAGLATAGRILLVEDDAGVRNATRFLLKSAGYEVIDVASLGAAIEQVHRDPRVDLLLTDYHLAEGETGIEVIASVRKELGRPLHSVLMTGDTSPTIQALRPDPRMRIASKPVNAEELLRLLGALLSERAS